MAPPRSTARFISYDLRPSKQAERRILVDVLRSAANSNLPLSNYRYVGMGANRFYDFLLIHKYLGLKSMVSLEHDPKMYERAMLNRPYDFITVRKENSADFISADGFTEPSVVWLDYDGGIGPALVGDIADLGQKLKVGDFCFVTTYGGTPGALENANRDARLAWLQDNLSDVAGDVKAADVEKGQFYQAVHKVLLSAYRNAFAARRDGRFYPFVQIVYSDSVPMITVGGALLTEGQSVALQSALTADVPFLPINGSELFKIDDFHLTERERVIFDMAATKKRANSPEMNTLVKLGFKPVEVLAYKRLLRYLPRYVETIV